MDAEVQAMRYEWKDWWCRWGHHWKGRGSIWEYFLGLPDLLLIKRGRACNPAELAEDQRRRQDILRGPPIIWSECGVPLSQGITRFIAPIPVSPTPLQPPRLVQNGAFSALLGVPATFEKGPYPYILTVNIYILTVNINKTTPHVLVEH